MPALSSPPLALFLASRSLLRRLCGSTVNRRSLHSAAAKHMAVSAPPQQPPAEGRSGTTEALLSWEELAASLRRDPSFTLTLRRTSAMQARYAAAAALVLTEWATLGDNLLSRLFGWRSVACDGVALSDGTTGRRLKAVPPDGWVAPGPLVWIRNEYGYAFQKDVCHDLVWCADGAAEASQLDAFIEENRPSGQWERVIFVSPPHLRSVGNVWHAHVLSHRRLKTHENGTNGAAHHD